MTKRLIAITLGVALAGVATVAFAARDSNGTFTLQSVAGGYPYTSGSKISSSGVNANMAEVVTALSDSLSRSGNGGMTAPLRTADGTAALPALSFTNDTNTGVYRVGGDRIGLALGGALDVEFAGTFSRFVEPVTITSSLTVSGAATVTGATTLSSTLSSGAITAPSVTSSGAKLSLTAPATYDTEIAASATVGFTVKADGTNDNKSRRLVNVTDPAGAQDAATRASTSIANIYTNTIGAHTWVSGAARVALRDYSAMTWTSVYGDSFAAGAGNTRITLSSAGTYLVRGGTTIIAPATARPALSVIMNGSTAAVYGSMATAKTNYGNLVVEGALTVASAGAEMELAVDEGVAGVYTITGTWLTVQRFQ